MECTWSDPGIDPYTGSARAAIMAFAQIPRAVRGALVARAESKDLAYDEVVVIDRDAIRGRARYAPELRSMHFGSRGSICDTVSRAGWAAEHVETAMVFCASGYCVARPAVCNNWSIVLRLDDGPTPEPAGPNLAVAPQGPAEPPPGISEPAPSASAAGPTFAQASSERWLSFGTPGIVDGPQAWMPAGSRAPIAPVPEPSIMVLLGLGMAGLIAWRRM